MFFSRIASTATVSKAMAQNPWKQPKKAIILQTFRVQAGCKKLGILGLESPGRKVSMFSGFGLIGSYLADWVSRIKIRI